MFGVSLLFAINEVGAKRKSAAKTKSDKILVGFTMSKATVKESQNFVTLKLRLNKASKQAVAVEIAAIEDGTTPGSDYEILSPLRVGFAPGEMTKEVSIQIIDDDDNELETETVRFEITSVDGAKKGPHSSFALNITDNDYRSSNDSMKEDDFIASDFESDPSRDNLEPKGAVKLSGTDSSRAFEE